MVEKLTACIPQLSYGFFNWKLEICAKDQDLHKNQLIKLKISMKLET